MPSSFASLWSSKVVEDVLSDKTCETADTSCHVAIFLSYAEQVRRLHSGIRLDGIVKVGGVMQHHAEVVKERSCFEHLCSLALWAHKRNFLQSCTYCSSALKPCVNAPVASYGGQFQADGSDQT